MATTSGTPAPTRLVTAEWRVSWNTTPLARSYGMPSASQVRRKCVARYEHVPLARIGLRSGARVFTEDRREAARGAYRAAGAKLREFYLVTAVVVAEAPDDETAVKLSLALGAR